MGKDGTTCLIAATRYGNPSETIKVREGGREEERAMTEGREGGREGCACEQILF